ncbi:hypothetical protein [Pseudomonas putida]
MKFECDAGQAGPITAGMSRTEVRSRLGPCTEFLKSKFSVNSTDDFSDLNLHVFYDADNKVRGVELFQGAEVVFRGLNVFDSAIEDLSKALNGLGVALVANDSGFEILGGLIKLYAGDAEASLGSKVEAFYVVLN